MISISSYIQKQDDLPVHAQVNFVVRSYRLSYMLRASMNFGYYMKFKIEKKTFTSYFTSIKFRSSIAALIESLLTPTQSVRWRMCTWASSANVGVLCR